MTRHLRTIPLLVSLALIGLLAFAGTAFAANTVDPADGSLDVAKSIYNALTGGHYAYAGALLVILVVALVKRYLGPKIVWLHSDAGGATLALLASGATALAASLAGGGPVTLGMVKTSALVGIGAAGGYATIKALVVEPLLKPLEAWAPPWMAPAFALVGWIFDKPDYAKQAEAAAKAAGDKAVQETPATGAAGVIGTPTDVK